MGKGQSKSYDISSGTQKASHKRPKSSQQRESLLIKRESQNLNGDTQLNNQINLDSSVDSNSNLGSPDKRNEKTEVTDTPEVTETIKEEVNTVENSESLNSLNGRSSKTNSDSSEYNPEEESDQIDRALEEYIESHKKQETVVKEDTVPKEVTVTGESDDKEEVIHKEGEGVETKEVESKSFEVSEDHSTEGEVIQSEVESNEEILREDVSSPVDSEEKDIEEDNQEAQINFEAEDELNQDTPEITEDQPVEDSDTVQSSIVINLQTTPPGSELSPVEADTREQSGHIIDLPAEGVPSAEPAIPIEEPTLPESALIVSAEVPVAMPTMEAVVCGVDDLKDGEMKEVDVGEGKALLVREKGQFYAVGNKCTHYGAPLATGALCNGRVRCPWHGACFNVKTGDIEDFPGLDSLPKFEVTVADGKVKVKGDKALLTSSKVQKSMCKQLSSNQQSVLIIGGGPASVMCAETLRKEGFTGKITIATQEKHLPYDRVKLSKAMDSTAEGIALRNADFYKTNNIDIQTNKKAISVDSKAKTVKFEDGSSLSYTSLVLATGGKPRQLPISGANFDNVCLLRTPDDANKIAEAAKGKNVVIIGSSFIGMEVAAFLADKAASLSVVDIIKVPFQLVLGEKVGSVLQKLHEDQGVKFYFEKGIKEFVGNNNKATEAVLSDDTRVPCDLAILGVGVVPATDFLKDSGINMTNRGFIPVDKHMKTNVDGIYAAGDIVEFPLFSADDQQVNVQHWQMAHAHGKAAALGILDKKVDIRSVPFFWTMMYKKSIRYTGYGLGYDDIVVHGDPDAPKLVAFYTKGDVVVAVATLGADPVAAQVAEIMYSGQKILKSEIQSSVDAITEKFAKL